MGDAVHALLREVSTQHGVIHAEAMRSTASGMVLCSTAYSQDEKLKIFQEESASFCFPLKVGIPGRVWHSGKVEWHADVTQLPAHQYLRKSLAIRAGFRGTVAIPFTWDNSPRTAAPQPVEPDAEFTRRISSEMAESLHPVSQKGSPASSEEAESWSVVLIFYSTAVFSESDVDALLSSVDQVCARLQEHPADTSGASAGTSTETSDAEPEPALTPEHRASSNPSDKDAAATAAAASGAPSPLGPAVKRRLGLGLGVKVHADSCPNLAGLGESPATTPRTRRRAQLWQESKQEFKMASGLERGECVFGGGAGCQGKFQGASRRLAELEQCMRDAPAEGGSDGDLTPTRTRSAASSSTSDSDVEEVGKVLQAVCEECNLVYGEAFTASKGDKSTMMVSSARYCAGPAQEEFHAASLSMTFADGVGIPGRVYQRRRMEWHADCTLLPDDSDPRKQLAAAAGFRGVVALPFTLNRMLFVLAFFSAEAVENKHVLTILGLASNILQRLRVARHPQRFESACIKPSSPGGSPLAPRRGSTRASSPASSPLHSPRPDKPDAWGEAFLSPPCNDAARCNSLTSDSGKGPRLGSLLLLATAHSNSMRVMRNKGARSLSLQASDQPQSPSYVCDDDQQGRRASLTLTKSNSFRGLFRDGWSDCADADDSSAASESSAGPEHMLSSSCPEGQAGEFDVFSARFTGFLSATEEECGVSRSSSAAGLSRAPSAVPVRAGT